jgi:hypothetical protein
MPVTRDIAASYTGPRTVFRRLLAMGENEGRALAILMAGCVVTFVAQWPRLSREAHQSEQDLYPMMGAALLAWMFIAPLIFYVLAFLSGLTLRVFGGNASGFAARLALFWALLAASPLMLLNGLVAGFIGPGGALMLVGALWCIVFLWFWLANLREAGWG